MKLSIIPLKVILAFAFLLNFSCGIAQIAVAKLTVIRGGTIEFFFNSIQKVNDGIIYNNWTVLDLAVNNDVISKSYTWKLTVEPEPSGLTNFKGGNASSPIPMDAIFLNPTGVAGVVPSTLSSTPTIIATGSILSNITGDRTNFIRINISYECGTTASNIVGKLSGYYFVDLRFVFEATP